MIFNMFQFNYQINDLLILVIQFMVFLLVMEFNNLYYLVKDFLKIINSNLKIFYKILIQHILF